MEMVQLPEGCKAIRYRSKFSSGYSEWKLQFFLTPMSDEEVEGYADGIKEEIDHQYYWADHYRGVDYEVVNEVPKIIGLDQVEVRPMKLPSGNGCKW